MNSVEEKMMMMTTEPELQMKKNDSRMVKRMGVNNGEIRRLGVSNQKIKKRMGV
jgi:hypothetical protein